MGQVSVMSSSHILDPVPGAGVKEMKHHGLGSRW